MRFVAVGDSFTEGVGDERPDGSVRGWADLVAAHLSQDQDVEYANLAIRGRLLTSIATTQLDQALAMDPPPTFMTFNGGGNDMLRSGFSVPALTALTHRSIHEILANGIELVVLTSPDPTEYLPMGKVVRGRARELTEAITELVQGLPLTYVNTFADQELRDGAGYWPGDRLHLGPHGHRRVADLVLQALGHPVEPYTLPADHPVAPAGDHSDVTLAETGRRAVAARLSTEMQYYREHVVPWIERRLLGRSSGDAVTAKQPFWGPVPG